MVIKLGDKGQILDVAEIAATFDITQETVRAKIRSGELKAHKLGKKYWVTMENLAAWALGECLPDESPDNRKG